MKARTQIKFAVPTTTYEATKGTTTQLKKIEVKIGYSALDDEDITTDTFYCEWINHYGTLALQQQQLGVVESARVKMPYVNVIVEALKEKTVYIYKNGIEDDKNTFILNSSVDDKEEQHQEIEFQVKKLIKK